MGWQSYLIGNVNADDKHIFVPSSCHFDLWLISTPFPVTLQQQQRLPLASANSFESEVRLQLPILQSSQNQPFSRTSHTRTLKWLGFSRCLQLLVCLCLRLRSRAARRCRWFRLAYPQMSPKTTFESCDQFVYVECKLAPTKMHKDLLVCKISRLHHRREISMAVSHGQQNRVCPL